MGTYAIVTAPLPSQVPGVARLGTAHLCEPGAAQARIHLRSRRPDARPANRRCSPSRTAILTSRRPDSSRTWSVKPSEYWRDRGGNFSTLPQFFRERGYLSLGIGKIFHPGVCNGAADSCEQ